ncbi:hypothetical protein RclHR1_06650007 [Rhizophagus clarus]|uniref:Uncharacterized protein n=1 Tax=Rhizophagus clarus TaxID=94130 RepID=A0A2Z6SJ54_9GLOM|nr:hypothetical protein RclHR1_06650007 [Rhizophagus clarus]GES95378.1 hypothetical protein GLOIN_2v1470350 [Rhizophagus clarus]
MINKVQTTLNKILDFALQMDKMDKMDKPNKVNRLNKMYGNKPKIMDNGKLMQTSILIVLIVLGMTIFVKDESMWNSLSFMFEMHIPGIKHYLPRGPPRSKDESQIDRFTNSTTLLFQKISLAEIPAPSEITQHVDNCNKLAALMERCGAYGNNGKIAAEHLRRFSNLLYEAGDTLREMFAKSKSVHSTFEIEVKSMVKKFNNNYSIFTNHDYFVMRILKLKETITGYRVIVDKTMQKILEVQGERDIIIQQLFDAQIKTGNKPIDENNKIFDITTEAIKGVNVMQRYLSDMAVGLREIRGKLKDYEINVNNVKVNLDVSEMNLTEESLQYLEAAVMSWKESWDKFLSKQHKPVISVGEI